VPAEVVARGRARVLVELAEASWLQAVGAHAEAGGGGSGEVELGPGEMGRDGGCGEQGPGGGARGVGRERAWRSGRRAGARTREQQGERRLWCCVWGLSGGELRGGLRLGGTGGCRSASKQERVLVHALLSTRRQGGRPGGA
jgi:hypothetical protein